MYQTECIFDFILFFLNVCPTWYNREALNLPSLLPGEISQPKYSNSSTCCYHFRHNLWYKIANNCNVLVGLEMSVAGRWFWHLLENLFLFFFFYPLPRLSYAGEALLTQRHYGAWVQWNQLGNLKYAEQNLSWCYFVHHISDMDWPVSESGLQRCENSV